MKELDYELFHLPEGSRLNIINSRRSRQIHLHLEFADGITESYVVTRVESDFDRHQSAIAEAIRRMKEAKLAKEKA